MWNESMSMKERILELFLQNPNRFVSGEELSRQLQCTRTAVWKHIRQLQEDGYAFEAVPRRGYRLTGKPDRFDKASILAGLTTKVMGRNLHVLDEVDSTQATAHALAAQGAPEGTLVLAERQTAGRGRMGRSWHSPAGKGIWMSLVLTPPVPVRFVSQLTLVVAVAVCRAIRRCVDVDVGIKWPNDLMVGNRKVCGILLESRAEDERLCHVAAGIGISVNLDADDFPENLRDVATSLKIESGADVDRTQLVCEVMREIERLYGLYREQGFAPIRLLWEALSVSLHRPVRIRVRDGWVEGVAQAIDDDGALDVRMTNGQMRKFFAGDVEFR
jgi:BirA family biotin operon repressor/biotin-[acetyl-CoA-carboxylase] ligase